MTLLLASSLLSSSLPALAPVAAPDPVWKAGDRVEARVEIRMTNKAEELDMTEVERWTLEIDKVDKAAVQARLTRALLETRLNGASAGVPPGSATAEPWTFRADGSLAFRPLARTLLEGRLYRLMEALLPLGGSDPAGRETVEFADEGAQGFPAAVLARDLRRKESGLRPVDFTYREEGVRMGGRVVIDEANGWPLFWTLRISGLRLEGGEIPVETTVTMVATKASIRGKSVGLPSPKGIEKQNRS